VLGSEFRRLLDAARHGDDDAFAELYRDAQPMLVRYLRVAAEPGTAEDVAADTWVTVVRGLKQFRGDEHAWRGWLVTTARRRAIDAGRLRDRRPTVPLEAGDEPPAAPGAERVALDNLDTAAALRLVATLPPQQAEAVMLRVVVGLEPKQVARVLGCSPGAARVAVHRGLQRLAVTLSASPSLSEHEHS
jgi:RNA polymerase sigma-70 factor (ECF subfamily)